MGSVMQVRITPLAHFGRVAMIALAAFFGACSSVNPYAANRETLEVAHKSLQAQKYAEAARAAEALYAGRAEQSSEFRLQRYYAAYLAAQAHIQAALNAPFLNEAASSDANKGIVLNANAPASGLVPSPMSHWVAASYYAAYANDGFAAAAKEPLRVEDEELLPIGLKKIDVARVDVQLKLVRLATLTRLGFDVECAAMVEGTEALRAIASCTALLEQAELPAQLWPWVFYSGFKYLAPRGTDLRTLQSAYFMGAKARMLAADVNDVALADAMLQVRDWAQSQKNYEFHCGCNVPFLPDVLRCGICGKSIGDAKPAPRTSP
jgi:hypothetical protein